MPTNAMGREAANPGKAGGRGGRNADRDREAARSLKDSMASRDAGTAADFLSRGWGPSGIGSATAADFGVATGRVSTPSGKVSGEGYDHVMDAYDDYTSAIGEYETRSGLWSAADVLAGPFLDVHEPVPEDPRTFRDGTFHTSTNVGGVIGSIAGSVIGGPILGQVGGILGRQLGLDVYHDGFYDDGLPATGMLGGGTGNGGDGDYMGSPEEEEEEEEDPATPPKPRKPVPFSDIRLADVVSAADYLGL